MERHHQNLHISHHWHLSDVLKNKYNDLVVADTFRLLALSMVSLFVPIFLLDFGYSIYAVCMFELMIFVGSLIVHFLVARNISFFGVKKTMIVSYIFNVLFYLVLFYSDILAEDFGGNTFLVFLAFLDIVALSFYWTSHHVYFLSVTEMKSGGKKLGILLAIPNMIGIAGPFLGSVLITSVGFKGVFLISSILLVVAAYVLSFSKNIVTAVKVNLKDVLDFKGLRKNLIFVIQGTSYVATGFAWPLLLFFMSIKLISMGLLYLISGVVYSTVSYLGGKKTDTKGNSKKISQMGAIGQGFSLIFRSLSTTILGMTVFQTLGGFFGGLLHVSLDSCFYRHSHKNVGSAIMNRELYMYIGRIMMIIVFLAALSSFTVTESLIFVLMISGVFLFLLNLIVKNDSSFLD